MHFSMLFSWPEEAAVLLSRADFSFDLSMRFCLARVPLVTRVPDLPSSHPTPSTFVSNFLSIFEARLWKSRSGFAMRSH